MRSLVLAIVSTLFISLPCFAEDAAPAASSHDHSQVDPNWGFKLRLKASVGLLTRDLVEGRKFLDSGDVGLMVEPFHFHKLNLNGYVGFRTAGLGLGHDITDTLGVAVVFATPWHTWKPTPLIAATFAF